jgi:hypothetical protein
MDSKIAFVNSLLTCCDRVYVANQSPNTPVYPLILYEQVQNKPIVYADNAPRMQQKTYWVYLYNTISLATLEANVDAALSNYTSKLIRESTNGPVISKIKEYSIFEEVE